MSALGGGKANAFTFQNNMVHRLVANGWLLGKAEHYNCELAMYPEDLLGFVQDTQPKQWQKLCPLYSNHPEQNIFEWVAGPLNKAAPNLGSALRAFCAATLLDRCEPAKALAA